MAMVGMLWAPGSADILMREVRQTVQGKKDAQIDTVQYWISETKIRTDEPMQTALMDLDAGTMTLIDHKKKTHSTITFAEINQAGAQSQQDLPPEMAAMLGSMMKMDISITPTGESKKIGDWQCSGYKQTMAMGIISSESQIFATSQLKMHTAAMNKLRASLLALQPGAMQMAGTALKEYEKIDGVMVWQQSASNVMRQQIVTTIELIDYQDKTAPAGTYTIPAKYKQKKFEDR
jgi:hypothetical protein